MEFAILESDEGKKIKENRMPSQYHILLLPLKDMEENLEELLTRCRQLRQEALMKENPENLHTLSNQEERPNFCLDDTWIKYY